MVEMLKKVREITFAVAAVGCATAGMVKYADKFYNVYFSNSSNSAPKTVAVEKIDTNNQNSKDDVNKDTKLEESKIEVKEEIKEESDGSKNDKKSKKDKNKGDKVKFSSKVKLFIIKVINSMKVF